jgi:glycosyltransferase involved in cell wall biosynthesis
MTPRVLVLTTLAGLGGAERSLLELVRRLRDDLAFTLVVPDEGPLGAAARAAGADVRIVPWPAAFAELGERARRRGATPACCARRRRSACSASGCGRRSIGSHPTSSSRTASRRVSALACSGAGVPLVWYAREGLEDRPTSRFVLRLLGRRPAGVVAISRYVAGQFRPLVAGPAPVHVVRNIVDPGRLRPGMPLPADLRKPPGAVWLGVVGALTPLKGQDVFLDAAARVAARVPTARFLVVGGEPYRTEQGLGWAAKLAARVRAHGLEERVDFLGERDDAPAVIANLDVLVQPSRGPEGLGRTILEAMACAVPVIAVDRWGPQSRDRRRHRTSGPTCRRDWASRRDDAPRGGCGAAGAARRGGARRSPRERRAGAPRARLHGALASVAEFAPARPATGAQAASAGGRCDVSHVTSEWTTVRR